MSLNVLLLFSFQGTKREIHSLKTEPNNQVRPYRGDHLK